MTSLDSFKVQSQNANAHTDEGLELLEVSILEHGWIGAITVAADGETFDGSARLDTIKRVMDVEPIIVKTDGSRPVIVQRTDIDNAESQKAKLLAIAANRIAEVDLNWDKDVLAALSEDIDLNSFFSEDELDDILSRIGEGGNSDGGDSGGQGGKQGGRNGEQGDLPTNEYIDIVDGKIPSRVSPGQVWAVANQTLICGDSKNSFTWEKLLKGRKADVVITSPPYASQREYDKDSGFEPIDPDEYSEWYQSVAENIYSNLASNGNYLLNIKEHIENKCRHPYVMQLVIDHICWKFFWVEQYVWKKCGLSGDPKRWGHFRNDWEPIFHFSKSNDFVFYPESVRDVQSDDVPSSENGVPECKEQGRGRKLGHKDVKSGLAYPSNVLTLGNNREKMGHSAMFPVTLPEFMIKCYSLADDAIVDPFCGGGSTLVAAYQLGRDGYGVEISPRYCEIILRRLEKLTGETASLI